MFLVLGASAGCGALFDVSALGPPSDDAGERADGPGDASDVGDAGDALLTECPDAKAGPALVPVGTFCIDAHEVSNGQYAEFLAATSVSRPALPSSCAFKTTSDPRSGWPPSPSDLALPVRNVDWCDALSFCLWSGKRLCGRIGGGASLRANEVTNPAVSQWSSACERESPLVPDLTGGVAEWIDACESAEGQFDECRVAGGSDASSPAPACDAILSTARGSVSETRGFRCCGP